MTSTDDNAQQDAEQQTVQNADGVTDGEAGAPDDSGLTPAQKAARTRAANKAAKENEPASEDHAPADLRTEHRVSSSGGEHDKAAIVHLYDFDNGYTAKVYQRKRGDGWGWAPMRDGQIVRNIPGLGRVPQEEASVDVINDGLALVAALAE